MGNLKILTSNVRGFAEYNKRRSSFYHYHCTKLDVIFLQETHSTKSIEKVWNTQIGSKIWYSHGTNRARGVAILVAKSLDCKVHNIITDNDGRYIILYTTIYNKKIILCNVYAPNVDDANFFQLLFTDLQRFSPDHYIIGGDFNTVIDPRIDKQGGNLHTHENARKNIKANSKIMGLVDIWRKLHQGEAQFTWTKLHPNPIFERLDYFLINIALCQMVLKCEIQPGIQTEHSSVLLHVSLEFAKRGPGYWKFNTSLLRDQEYISKINSLLEIELAQEYKTKRMKWEMVKLAVRGSTIQYSARVQKSDKNKIEVLQRKVKQMQDKLQNIPTILIDSNIAQIKALQKEINEILNKKSMGAVIRSRANWEHYADRPSKYFLNLEKMNYSRKTIYRLENQNGNIESDPKEILKMQKEFYDELYTATVEPDLSYISDIDAPKIPETLRDALEKDITLQELSKAVNELPNNKAPSTDGIPIDFYKVFWGKLQGLFLEVVNEIVEDKKLHTSARQGIISLLVKPAKNPLKLKSFRPLTLLNADYKIYSKTLAMRLHTALEKVIHHSQTGFLRGRHISENAMKLMNIMEYCDRNSESAVILSLDFEKAFDKLLWPAAFESLKMLGIGPRFIEMIKILYNSPTSSVINNGYWSEWIKPTRGTRQGDPISSLIFTAAAEVLGIKLRTNIEIQGIQINEKDNILNVQYADDTWLALKPTEENINNALDELDRYARFSGLSINFEKSTAFLLGPLRDTDAKFYTMKQLYWSDGPVKILGIYFHPDWMIMHKENYENALTKINTIINKWTNRSLSIPGKITIINSLIASQLVYKFMSIPSPNEQFFKEYKRIILEFLWSKKPSKIKYNKLVQKYEDGGLKLIDLRSKDIALKAAWVPRWKAKKSQADLNWIYINLPIKDERIWLCNISQRDLTNLVKVGKLDMGYQVLKAWNRLNYSTVLDQEMFTHTPIWLNSEIRRADEPFVITSLINSNMKTLADIWNRDEGRFLKYNEILHQIGTIRHLDQLRYNSVISAIPNMWKQLIKHLEFDEEASKENRIDKLCKHAKPSNKLYWQHVDATIKCVDSSCLMWATELKIHPDNLGEKWEYYLLKARTISNSAKLRYFQYRILNHKITTNVMRAKWDQNISELCSFCFNERETVMHIMVECPNVAKLWKTLSNWCNYHYEIKTVFDASTIILNDYQGKEKNYVNTLILILKQFIYSQKCKSNSLKFIEFISVVDHWYNLEKVTAIANNNYHKFKNKWKLYIEN